MAVAFDAFFNQIDPDTVALSWTHTPVGTPAAVIVFVSQAVGATDEVTGVTYGALSLTEMSGSPVLHTTGEPGAVYAYFAGSSIPTGAQTVTVSVNGTASSKSGCSITLTASSDCEIVDVDATVNSDSQADPSVTLSLAGRTCFCALGFYSGANAVGGSTPFTDWTDGFTEDFGSFTGGFYTYNTIGTTDVTAGWTQVADDAAMIAVAVSEVQVGRASKNTRAFPLGVDIGMGWRM